jgi:hypothetical protein
MVEESEYAKEKRWQSDSRAFVWATLKHWEARVGAFFATAAVAYYLAEGNVMPVWFLGLIVGVCFVVGCFHAWRGERRAKEAALKELDDLKAAIRQKEKEALEIAKTTQYSQEPINSESLIPSYKIVRDPVLGVWAVRLAVSNKTTRVVQGVVVALEKISTEKWKDDFPYESLGVTIPHSLPLKPNQYGDAIVFECSINPEATRQFDMFYLRHDAVDWNMGLPPYERKGWPPSYWTSKFREMLAGLGLVGTHEVMLEVSISAPTFPKNVYGVTINIPSGKIENLEPSLIISLRTSGSLGLNSKKI